MIYDPREAGAQCDKCVLSMRRMGTPVPPEYHLGRDQVLAVGEFPNGESVAEGVPFIGPPGQLAMVAFGSYGLTREQVAWTNSVLCRPPDNRMEVIDRETAALNQAAKRKGLPPLFLRPWQACRTRLFREMREHGLTNVVAMGPLGLKTLLNDDSASITKNRGFPAQLGIDVRPDGGGLSYVITDALESHFDYSILTRFTVMPTLHPDYVLRQRRWTKIFSGDIGRALRIFRGQDTWVPPNAIYVPTPKQVRDFLLGQRLPFWVHDVETDSKYPLKAKLRCIGFSDEQNAIVVPWLSIDGHTTFYIEAEQAEIDAIVTEFYADKSRIKCGWNSANYDRIVIKKKFGVVPFPEMDGLQMHRSIDSELPHNLGFVASCWTEVPRAWKKDHTATDPHSDRDLWVYNHLDCVLNARCIPPLWAAVTERQQVEVVKMDLKVTSICASMHENGLAVDQKRRAEREHECLNGEVVWRITDVAKWKAKLTAGEMTQADYDKKVNKWEKLRERLVKEICDKYTGGHIEWQPADPLHYVMSQDGTLLKKGLLHYKAILQEIAEGLGVFGPKGRFNPNSTDQVAQVIFDKWEYVATEFTNGGKPSTGDDVLLQLMADLTDKKGKIHQVVRYQFFDSLRWFRRLSKELGTYILKFKSETEIRDPALEELAEDLEEAVEDGDETAQQKLDKLLTSKKLRYGCVSLDGRLHSGWRAHAATGRLSSSDPVNNQNIPAHLRDMIVPAEGNELVTADMDQVELRAVASYARSTPLLEIFDRIYKKRKTGQKIDKLSPIEDPYSMNAAAIFGKEFTDKDSASKDRLRTFAKIFTLASIYGADPIVKWGILRAAEDKEGKLAYLKISQREVRKFHEEWCKANYEIVQWWSDVWAEFKSQGYLIEPVMGRRRDFLDDGDEEEVKKEVYNYKAQAGCSARIHLATIDIVENLIPFNKWGPGTGLIAQVHDSLTFEVPKGLGKALVPQVEERMESRDANVVYTASGLVQQHWGMK